jgi:adhesin/invasin
MTLLRSSPRSLPRSLPRSHAHSPARSRSRLPLFALTLGAVIAACGGNDPASPTTPRRLEKVSGDSQSVVVAAALAQPMVVRLLAENGSALAGTTVTWALGSATSGALAGVSSTTDGDGRASMSFTAGTIAGTATITATVEALAPITFSQKIVAGPAASLAKAIGDGVAALAGAGVQLAVRVVDANGNPVSGVTVAYATGTAGGTLSAATVQSDASGLARVTLTLGATPGEYTVTATSGTLPAVTFRVTAI